jgi:hypothetical protein
VRGALRQDPAAAAAGGACSERRCERVISLVRQGQPPERLLRRRRRRIHTNTLRCCICARLHTRERPKGFVYIHGERVATALALRVYIQHLDSLDRIWTRLTRKVPLISMFLCDPTLI